MLMIILWSRTSAPLADAPTKKHVCVFDFLKHLSSPPVDHLILMATGLQ